MQAVMLAGGKSTRTYPLTLTRPKPLLCIANRTLLERNLENLRGIADELILVVGYKKEMIVQKFGKSYKGIKITYIEQREQLGTGHALLMAKDLIKGRFIAMAGDDLYAKKDIKACAEHKNAILASSHPHPERFGVIVESGGIMANLIEKPETFISNLINTSLYVLEPAIFGYLSKLRKSKRGEYELTDAVRSFSKKKNMRCVHASRHLAIGYPWDLLNADLLLRRGKNSIGKDCSISGEVVNSSIGERCVIKGSVRDSIIGDHSIVEEGSIIERSILGSDVHFDGTATASRDAQSAIGEKIVGAGFFGAAIGDAVIAKRVSVAPGVKVWPKRRIAGMISRDVL